MATNQNHHYFNLHHLSKLKNNHFTSINPFKDCGKPLFIIQNILWNWVICQTRVVTHNSTACPKVINHLISQTRTCSCCSFIRSPLCFFLIGGILSSSPLSLSLFFWCSSQASSVLVFSLRAFCRRWSRELWCCSLTSSSFMYWRTMSMVNCEKLSWPPEKAGTESWDCWQTRAKGKLKEIVI